MLELKNLCAGYGKKQILSDISLSIPKSKLISVIGHNGSGKSTLLKSAMGIIPMTSGEVTVDGEKIDCLSRCQLAVKVAYLAQGKNVPDMTVRQLVMHGRFPHLSYPRRYTEKDRSIVLSALDELGISYLADRPLSSLSGGMRQNAYIAMALAQDSDFILLDEPTTYLDITHQIELMKTFRELTSRGKGVVTVLHDLPLAFAFSDSIVVLKEGKVAIEGAPSDVFCHPVIREVFGVELDYIDQEQSYRYKYSL
ncbi:MAG: ABC transporter ATP-binding protein [Ruminococcus sp.]